MSSCSLITVTGSRCSFLQLGKNIRHSSRKSYLSQIIHTKRLWMMYVIDVLLWFHTISMEKTEMLQWKKFFSKKSSGHVTFCFFPYL